MTTTRRITSLLAAGLAATLALSACGGSDDEGGPDAQGRTSIDMWVFAELHGTYYEATDAQSLADIYKSIKLEVTTTTEYTEVTAVFTMVGSALLVIGALLSVLWFGRVV